MNEKAQSSEGQPCEACENDGFVCCAIGRTSWPEIGYRCAAFVPVFSRMTTQKTASKKTRHLAGRC